MSEHKVTQSVTNRLPLDVSRCNGRVGMEPYKTVCSLRDTCLRYRALLSDKIDDYVPVMAHTDDGGACEYYMEVNDA